MTHSSNVSVRGVHVSYGNLTVLEQLDLEIEQSEFIVLLGPSGCGKSTLLNAISGLIEVDGGEIWIGGRDVTWEQPKDRGIAMVFQSYALYPQMTARKNMSFGLKVAGMPKDEVDRRVAEAARMLRIEDLLDRKPAQLSGGQRQRVAIGRALVRESGVHLFDEPLSNLDAQLRAELRVEIKRLHRALGSTMIYVTHDQIEALTLADQIAVMKDRVIQQLGAPEDIYLRPKNRFVASFVGSPAMNFIPGRLSGSNGDARFDMEQGDLSASLAGHDLSEGAKNGPEVELGIRPEHIVVGPDVPNGQDVVIDMVEPMGGETLVWTTIGSIPLSILVPSEHHARAGDTLRIGLPAARLNLFDAKTGERV